ncbi:MAG: site-2 protease family protein [Chloroflexota bacterium]|nr:site-2 protease family protein [Chloroflexota bacterium]
MTALLVGISFHEFSHAFAADRLGDPTPRYRGRLTINPLAHLDPLGTILLFIGFFGWGKPVPVNPNLMRNISPKAGMATVAAAGPLSNLIMAGLAGLPIKLDIVPWRTPFNVPSLASWGADDYLGLYLSSIVIFGIILAIFNLIPLAPLDGFRVAVGILPRELSESLARTEQWGLPILFIFLFGIPFLTGWSVNPFWDMMGPVANALIRLLTGVDTSVFG